MGCCWLTGWEGDLGEVADWGVGEAAVLDLGGEQAEVFREGADVVGDAVGSVDVGVGGSSPDRGGQRRHKE